MKILGKDEEIPERADDASVPDWEAALAAAENGEELPEETEEKE